jgi:hypothetical protein
LARLVELAVVVPVEVSGRLLDAVPVVADKVPSAIGRVRREIVLARFLGKLAVDQGLRELRSRRAPEPEHPKQRVDDTEQGVDDTEQMVDDTEPEPAPLRTEPVAGPANVPDAGALPLTDYDNLSSAQVVAKLDGLDEAELDAIGAYERAGRHRRTVLGKIDQLRSSEVEP